MEQLEKEIQLSPDRTGDWQLELNTVYFILQREHLTVLTEVKGPAGPVFSFVSHLFKLWKHTKHCILFQLCCIINAMLTSDLDKCYCKRTYISDWTKL